MTLPDRPSILLSTARASAPIPVVSPLTATYPNPALTITQKLDSTASQPVPQPKATLLIATLNPPTGRTNFETPKQKP